jgi:hypothetical protein
VRDRTAGGLGTGELPKVGKVTALLGLDRLHGTVLPIEEHAFTVGLVL